MTETIKELLTWLLPSGGLGAVIVWLTNKTLRNLRTTKEVHDTYKLMYEDVQKELKEVRNENKELYKIVARLERVVSRAIACKHYDNCPLRYELQQQKKHNATLRRADDRQPDHERSPRSNVSPDPGVESGTPDSDGEPP